MNKCIKPLMGYFEIAPEIQAVDHVLENTLNHPQT